MTFDGHAATQRQHAWHALELSVMNAVEWRFPPKRDGLMLRVYSVWLSGALTIVKNDQHPFVKDPTE
jgi:hypothetical protein